MLAFKLQTPVNHPEDSIQLSGRGKSVKSRNKLLVRKEHGTVQGVCFLLVFGISSVTSSVTRQYLHDYV
jgi:hypothetical protein